MKIVYPIVYALWYVLSLLPLRVLYVLSDGLFFLIYYVVRYRRPIVRKNLAASFPEKSEQELLAVERGFFHFFCDYLVESVKFMTMKEDELRRRMVFKGMEAVDEAINEGQSCAVYLGHYCNWEWVTTLPLWVTPKAQCGQIYHPIENAEFDQLFLSLRQRFGSVCIAMNDTLRALVGYRQKGQPVVIGFIADQVPHWRNIHHWCNFLNHDTPVLTGTERIARKMKQAAFYLSRSQCSSPGATGISGLHSRRTRGDRHSSRVEAKKPALPSSRDGYLWELTGWTQVSQAS